MATGDLVIFDEAVLALMGTVHDLDNDVIKVALIDNSVTAAVDDTTPTLGDYNQVVGAGYTAGGDTMTVVPLSEVGGVVTYDFSTDASWAQNGSGFTDAYQLLCYNSTTAGDEALFFVDLGGPVSSQSGPVTVTWNVNGIFTASAS